jgi:hypothetical protein
MMLARNLLGGYERCDHVFSGDGACVAGEWIRRRPFEIRQRYDFEMTHAPAADAAFGSLRAAWEVARNLLGGYERCDHVLSADGAAFGSLRAAREKIR